MIEIERDAAFRGFEICSDVEGTVVSRGRTKDGEWVDLFIVLITDSILFDMGEQGILTRYLEV